MEIYFIILPDRFLSFYDYNKLHDGLDLRSVAPSTYTIQSRFALPSQASPVYDQVIAKGGAALDNCWGFVDGTARPVCRPSENQ